MSTILRKVQCTGEQVEVRISVSGALNSHSVAEFEQAASEIPEHTACLIIDLAETTFIDQRAIGCLLGLRILLIRNDTQLLLENCSPSIWSVFERACIDHLFDRKQV